MSDLSRIRHLDLTEYMRMAVNELGAQALYYIFNGVLARFLGYLSMQHYL